MGMAKYLDVPVLSLTVGTTDNDAILLMFVTPKNVHNKIVLTMPTTMTSIKGLELF